MTDPRTYPKRLIEVDLPIKQISKQARREKSIRHGHISTLHIWWARRPLASCRSVLCAGLWLDPADDNCPQEFRTAAAEAIAGHRNVAGGTPLELSDSLVLRRALLQFIAEYSNWDQAANIQFNTTARAITMAAHNALGISYEERPMVLDPFAGGGAIPLEALRIGADAFASDLNPVAVILEKVVLEYIPRYGRRLREEVEKQGKSSLEEARKQLEQS
jgi:adenine-specific DNA methylase